jgi:hypothetical protein
MKRYPKTFKPWILWYAVILHLVAGTLIILNADAGHSTGPDGVVRIVGSHEVAGVVILASAALAIRYLCGGVSPIWLLPQQALLILAAANAVSAVLIGHYADGEDRSPEFILTDQLPVILLAVFYLFAFTELQWRWDIKSGLRRPRLNRSARPLRASSVESFVHVGRGI